MKAESRKRINVTIDRNKLHVLHLIERTGRHAARFAERLRVAGYEVLNGVVLNQVLVSFGDDETTAQIISDIQAEGTCWVQRHCLERTQGPHGLMFTHIDRLNRNLFAFING